LQIQFKSKHLLELYTKGKSKKYDVPRNIAVKFVKVVTMLEAAQDIYDLWRLSSLNFEKLKGHANRFSARLSQKWRLEMEIDWEDEEKTTGTVLISDLSSHYGD
jgi:proteic killer suppression protein